MPILWQTRCHGSTHIWRVWCQSRHPSQMREKTKIDQFLKRKFWKGDWETFLFCKGIWTIEIALLGIGTIEIELVAIAILGSTYLIVTEMIWHSRITRQISRPVLMLSLFVIQCMKAAPYIIERYFQCYSSTSFHFISSWIIKMFYRMANIMILHPTTLQSNLQ